MLLNLQGEQSLLRKIESSAQCVRDKIRAHLPWGGNVQTPRAVASRLKFGPFELDGSGSRLTKHGIPLKLQPQPLKVLQLLTSRAGEVVSREEIRECLWGDSTFVDFERSINYSINQIRAVLNDDPAQPQYVETFPRTGYRFIAEVKELNRPAAPSREEPEIKSENGAQVAPFDESQLGPIFAPEQPISKERQTTQSVTTRRAIARWLPVLIGLASITAFALLALGLNLAGSRDRLLGRPMSGEITSIAVLPLKNLTGDPEQEYFVDGMTEALITELGKISSLRVISRTSAMSFKDSNKPLPEIARQLGVDAVLEGAVARNGDRVRISTRLIHLSQERTLWAENYERDLRDISTLQSEIVLVVADGIKVKLLNDEQARLAKARPVNPRAYEAFLHGRYLQARRTPEDMHKALVYFQHASEIDPSYAPAYVGIIDCYSIGGGRHMGISIKEADAKMKEAAHKVVELDGSTAEAHYAMAMVKWHDWDFPGAEKEFQRALELNPGDVWVRQHYAHYLIGMRRQRDERREIEHALMLDPLSSMLTVDLGYNSYYSRQYPTAIEQGRKALEMEPDSKYALNILAWSYWRQGLVKEALGCGWPAPTNPGINQRAQEIYARAGVKAMLRWLAEDAEQHNATGEFYARSGGVSLWYMRLDEKERALTWLEKAYQEHDPELPMDLADPEFDSLRSDPRFQDLLRRIGLPP
jgi:TolB-like protein/DNA-binding winged helix-turn-helix (wHTH) protein